MTATLGFRWQNTVKFQIPSLLPNTGSEQLGLCPAEPVPWWHPNYAPLWCAPESPVCCSKEVKAPEPCAPTSMVPGDGQKGGSFLKGLTQQSKMGIALNRICFLNISFKCILQNPAGTKPATQNTHSHEPTHAHRTCSDVTRRHADEKWGTRSFHRRASAPVRPHNSICGTIQILAFNLMG